MGYVQIPIKTRSRTTTVPYPAQKRCTDHSNHNSFTTEFPGGNLVYQSLHEELIQGKTSKKKFNGVRHYKKVISGPSNMPGNHLVQNGGDLPLDCYNPHNGEGRFGFGAAHSAFDEVKSQYTLLKDAESLASYGRRAMLRMQPDLTEISIPNFLYEMKDFKGLFSDYRKNWASARKLWNSLRARADDSRKVSGDFLQWAFNYAPLQSDVGTIKDSVQNFKSALDTWIEEVGQPKAKSTTLENVDEGFYGSYTFPSNPTLVVNYVARRRARVQAFLRYRGVAGHTRGRFAGLLAFLDRVGVQADLRIYWNAVPFSFVVDWFLNVGDWLKQFSVDTLELPIELEDFCLQIKEELTVKAWVDNEFTFGNNAGPVKQRFQDWEFTEKIFGRYPFLPHPSDLVELKWKTPNFKQWFLGVNLVNAMRRHKL